ncbi:MAG TPA: M1 family metallopeptidase [Kofleriaceae bacterium]|nr:M1 family metallopeptidase [Kofleriaceae bacterium]
MTRSTAIRLALASVVVACTSYAPIALPPPPPPTPTLAPFPTPEFRISHAVEPVRYRARLALGTTSFTGHVELDATLASDVSLFWLHAVGLRMSRARAIRGDITVELEVSPQRDQQLGFRAHAPLAAGAWTIAIDYTGVIHELEPQVDDPPFGLRDRWTFGVFRREVDGATYIASQSEAIYARQIFPCIDEPDRKVPWQLTLDVADGLVAAGNAPIARTTSLGGHRTRVELAETLPLPSYLIAFAVGPFDVVDAGRVRILALRGHAANVATAAKLATLDLATLERWVGVPLPYPKLDLVEVSHPGWGAMENPGLITFDSRLLEDAHPDTTIAHELAHLWFGDIVTPAWWNDIWLNESFATYFAARLDGFAGAIDLDWWARAAAGETNAILPAATTHQLEARTFAPDREIEHGAGVLAALERWLGSDAFLHSVHAYLTAHANGTVTTTDLATAFGPAIADELYAMLDGGWPTLAVTLDCTAKPHVVTTSSTDRAWPLCVAYDRDGKRGEACGTSAEPLELPAHACPRWLLANANARGMYTLRWDSMALDALLARAWKQLTLAEKIYIFDQQSSYAAKLDVLAKLDGERDPRWLDREAALLASVARYVPSDLAAVFAKRAIDRFAATARAADLLDERDAHAVAIIEQVGDPATEAHAKALFERARDLANAGVDLPTILALAMRSDPALADRVFRDLDVSGHDYFHISVEQALGELPSIVDLLARNAARSAKLPSHVVVLLLRNVCDAASRDRVVALLGNKDATDLIDRCISTKQALDSHFRAWLTH